MTGPVRPMNPQHSVNATNPFPVLEDLAKGRASSIPVIPKEPSKCPLFCCFYSEFDIKKGPVVQFQSPKGFMDQDINISVEKIHGLLQTNFSELMAESSIPGVSQSNSDSTNKSATIIESSPSKEHQTSREEGTVPSDSSIVEEELSREDAYAPAGLSIFDSTSEYIITGSELTSKIVTLSTHAWHIMTRPTMISDARYERNALFFSVGLVLRRAADPRPFRPIISKLALTLEAMERESGYLTKPTLRPRIQTVLEQVLLSLNSAEWECNVLLNPSNALHLKLYHPPKPETSPVHDHEVPILLRRDLQLQMYDWDLAINWVILHIDGATNARQISIKAEVDLEMVLACLRVLKHHGVIALVSQFNYSNRYEFTPRATAMLAGKEPKLLQEALEFCWKAKRIIVPSGGSGGGEPQNGAQKPFPSSSEGSPGVAASNFNTHAAVSSPEQLSHPSHMAVAEGGFAMGGFSMMGSDASPQSPHVSHHAHDPVSPPFHPEQTSQYGQRIQEQTLGQHRLPSTMLSLTPSSSYPPRTMGLLGASHQSSNFRLAMMAHSGSIGVYPSSLEGPSATGTGIGGVSGLKTREDHRLWKSALAELYCACTRSLSFGDLWVALSAELPPAGLTVPNLSSQVPVGSASNNRNQASTINSSSINPRYRQSRYPSKGPSGDDGTEYVPLSSIMGGIALSPSETLHLENLRGGRGLPPTRDTSGNISRTSSTSAGPIVDWKDFFNRIDHRRFLTFGLAHGLLTRIHSYPCFPYAFPEIPLPGVASAPPTMASGLTSAASDSADSKSEAHLTPPAVARKSGLAGSQKGSESMGGSGGAYFGAANGSDKSYQLAKSVAQSMDGTHCDDALSCFFEKPYPQLVELVEQYAAQPDHKVISFFATAPTV